MNATILPVLRPPAFVDLYQQRVDLGISAIVDRGISVQASFSTLCAIEYLKSHNVSSGVIERVLLHPEQRRKTHH
ncbi:hypothetical protein [Rugamonas sp.]|uniref:hypothetical protein n=1 Tax=Rugamonas sp. TaxID=1926287 RepID=UPI0025F2C084|nr:hypothetical protein [Rugamonas sp.]